MAPASARPFLPIQWDAQLRSTSLLFSPSPSLSCPPAFLPPDRGIYRFFCSSSERKWCLGSFKRISFLRSRGALFVGCCCKFRASLLLPRSAPFLLFLQPDIKFPVQEIYKRETRRWSGRSCVPHTRHVLRSPHVSHVSLCPRLPFILRCPTYPPCTLYPAWARTTVFPVPAVSPVPYQPCGPHPAVQKCRTETA